MATRDIKLSSNLKTISFQEAYSDLVKSLEPTAREVESLAKSGKIPAPKPKPAPTLSEIKQLLAKEIKTPDRMYYLRAQRSVAVGYFHKLNSSKEALRLKFTPNSKAKPPANAKKTLTEIEFETVKLGKQNPLPLVFLARSDVDGLLRKDMQRYLSELSQQFSDFRYFPTQAQTALLILAFRLFGGIAVVNVFKKMSVAVRDRQWDVTASESGMRQTSPLNAVIKGLFMDAHRAKQKTDKLNPIWKLQWETDSDKGGGSTGKIDFRFISGREGGLKLDGYVPDIDSQSGVTIATGFDLGQRNEADLKRLKLPDDLIEVFKPYLGLKKQKAKTILQVRPLTITEAEGRIIDKAVKNDIIAPLKRNYLNSPFNKRKVRFSSLPSEAQTVIASVAFQYGPNLSSRTPIFWRAVTSQNWVKAFQVLHNFGDSYSSRRKLEAGLLKKILPTVLDRSKLP